MKKILTSYLFLLAFGGTLNAQDYIGCTKLKNLKLPVCTHVGDSAFIGCETLETVSFPESEPPGYGANAFAHPGEISLEVRTLDGALIAQWLEVPEWNAFQWKTYLSTNLLYADKWQFVTEDGKVTASGFLPNVPVRFVQYTGVQYLFEPLQDGTLQVILPPGVYLVSQQQTSQRILIK